MPTGATKARTSAMRPIYMGFGGLLNFGPAKNPRHRCLLLRSRLDFRQGNNKLFIGLFLPLLVVVVTAPMSLPMARQPRMWQERRRLLISGDTISGIREKPRPASSLWRFQ
jgi:hypothetical protein